jgi:leukotriene-A4 hydrolase
LAPLQDTPSVKYSYGACVTVQNIYNVLMSANVTSKTAVNDVYNQTCFKMDIPIASYMIALAIGDIQYQSLGGKVGLYAQPDDLDAAIL